MNFILAEKPSVAKDIAKALNCTKDGNCYKGTDYTVTWSFGHLLTLQEPEDYNPKYGTWCITDLPIIPQKYEYKAIPDTEKQLKAIKKILSSNTFESIIIATDPGREGQLIAMLILNYCLGESKVGKANIKRFWVSEALTEETIKKGLKNLKLNKEFLKLYESGANRGIADWLLGINFSRFFSLHLKNNFSVGRVQTAVLYLICKRAKEIKTFQALPFFQLQGIFEKDGCDFKGLYRVDKRDKFDKKEELDLLYDQIKDETFGTITALDVQEKRKSPPALLNLTNLQKRANQVYGLTAKETEKIAQKLYDEYKCLSYPRTPSTVMSRSDISLIREKIQLLKEKYPDIFKNIVLDSIHEKNKRVFNDEKVEDHHALIPENVIPETATDDEKKIYFLVLQAFAAAFYPDYEYKSLQITITVNKVDFYIHGINVICPGWMGLLKEEKSEEEETLPAFAMNENINIKEISVQKRMTKSPDFYKESEMLSIMEHPQALVETDDVAFKKNTGLGTPATRATIIETLVSRKYIERKKKKLLPLDKGVFLIEMAEKIGGEFLNFIQVHETAAWETALEEDPTRFFVKINQFLMRVFDVLKKTTLSSFEDKQETDFGKCPSCGSAIIENSKAYCCSAWRTGCKVTIWKTIANTTVTPELVKELLQERRTQKKLSFKRKDKSSYEAYLYLNENNEVKFDFN